MENATLAETAALLADQEIDRETAFEAAEDAADQICLLQTTKFWQELPIESRRAICAAHANLRTMISAMQEAGLA